MLPLNEAAVGGMLAAAARTCHSLPSMRPTSAVPLWVGLSPSSCEAEGPYAHIAERGGRLEPIAACFVLCSGDHHLEDIMGLGKGALLWLIGIPIPIILLIAFLMR